MQKSGGCGRGVAASLFVHTGDTSYSSESDDSVKSGLLLLCIHPFSVVGMVNFYIKWDYSVSRKCSKI